MDARPHVGGGLKALRVKQDAVGGQELVVDLCVHFVRFRLGWFGRLEKVQSILGDTVRYGNGHADKRHGQNSVGEDREDGVN